MQRNFLRGLLVCLIPCLVAALFAVRPEKYRLGIDLAGGTILVYEVNLERTKLRRDTEKGTASKDKDAAADDKEKAKGKEKEKDKPADGLGQEEMNQLAAQIKRRIDPTDIKNVTVRPSGDRRVEIILPTGGAAGGRANLSTEDIEEVKRLISQMGVLEFRIIANGPDDEKGITKAIAAIEEAKKLDAKDANSLVGRARRGLPPPSPDSTENVEINESKAEVRYSWVELGPEERESLGLSNQSENKSGLWVALQTRDTAIPVRDGVPRDALNCSMLVFSRECVNAEQIAKENDARLRLQDERARGVGTGAGKTDQELEALVNAKKVEYFALTRISDSDSLKVGGDITMTATIGNDRSFNLAVDFRFNSAGGTQFGKITRRNKPTGSQQRQLAILLDERIVSAPALHGEITNSGQITGGQKGFDKKTADRLVYILRSGALSAELRDKPVSENTIGPTLGEDTIRRGKLAVALAFVAILVFMLVYYRFAGVVACIALFANLLLTVGFMVSVNSAFTLAGLAGLVLTLGMAVDANVLIYERLREERNKGANIATAIRNGYDRAFPTIIDTHLTSIATAVVLYVVGNDNLKGFAISLTVGLVISLFTSLYMTRLMFDFWLHKRWLTELKMMKLFEKPNFRPMKYRNVFFVVTGVLTVLGLALFLYRGEQGLNVDFRGGTVFSGRLKSGEERGLTATPDGKPGYRELLSEDAQKKKLAVADGPDAVIWENRPTEEGAPVNTWDYTITYKDGTKATVTLTEQPAGANDAERLADVRKRASQLPDASVEQTFLSTDSFDMGKSKRFTVRTTEKQQSLVQVALDRLLRSDDGKTSLLDGATLSFETAEIEVEIEKDKKKVKEKRIVPVFDEKTGTVLLTFDKPTSRNFTRELLTREFKKIGADAGADTFTLAQGPMMNFGTIPTEGDVEIEIDGKKVKEKRRLPVFDEKTGTVTLTFDGPPPMNFTRELLTREFKKVGSDTFTLTPGPTVGEGRDRVLILNVANNPNFSTLKPGPAANPQERENQLVSLAGVLYNTKRAFEEDNGRTRVLALSVASNPALSALKAGPAANPQERALQLVTLAGALNDTKRAFDSTPEPDRLEVFDSTLAKETRTRAAIAIALSWAAIMLYLWLRFGNWTFGLAAVLCLVHDLCFTLGAIAVCHYLHIIPGFDYVGIQDFKIDLAAVAALLTLVGYSVSDTIVVFDRIREVRGKNPKLTPDMINDSVNQTLSRTILTATTVFLVSIVLYAFGGEGVHLFAFVMVMGVLVGTYSSIFVAAPLLLIFGEGHDAKAPAGDETTSAEKEEGAEEEVVEG